MSNSLFVQLLTEMGWDTQFKKYSTPSFISYSSYLLLAQFITRLICSSVGSEAADLLPCIGIWRARKQTRAQTILFR